MRFLIVYESMTGNVERFVNNLDSRFKKLNMKEVTEIGEPYILVTYTICFGEIPTRTEEFLQKHSSHALGVAVSGNKLWGNTYGRAGKLIEERFKIPLLMTFELSGMESDYRKFEQEADKVWQNGLN